MEFNGTFFSRFGLNVFELMFVKIELSVLRT